MKRKGKNSNYKNSNKPKKKNTDWETNWEKEVTKKIALWSIVIAIPLIFWLIIEIAPSLQPLRDSIAYSVIIKTLLFGASVYFTWFHSNKPNLIGKLISMIISISVWLPLVFDNSQITVLYRTVTYLILCIYAAAIFLIRRKWYGIIIAELLYFGLKLIFDLNDYAFVNNQTSFHFWIIPLIIASISFITCIVYILFDKLDMPKSELLALPFVVFMFTFAVPWCTIHNLNYALDFNEPIEKTAIIIETDIEGSAKTGTTYEFHLLIDEKEVELTVSQSDFYKYEKGNSYPVKLYQGAFNEPFYISGNR